jgi:hypothetical protein
MDDLVLVGAVSIIGLYAATALLAAGALFILLQVFQAAAAGDAGRMGGILAGLLILAVAYAGTGLWLQKSGRI